MIIESHHAEVPAGLPAAAEGGHPAPEAGSVEAVFAHADGTRVQRRWLEAAPVVRFEDLEPVAPFPTVPGRRWGPGWWWSATTHRHIAHGSQAMCLQLMVLDRDVQVVGLSARPVRLLWREPQGGRVLTWVPQIFARYADGTALLADCPATAAPAGARARRAAHTLAAACHAVGFRYRRLAPPEGVLAANVRWLAGYRHPRHRDQFGLEQPVLEAFATARPLMEGAQSAGDVLAVLPVLYHALWSGRLSADLTRPLGEHTPVGPGRTTSDSRDGERDAR
ncbi:TnsA-like heteromeric transposase endonuclease subunit [Streptomyces albicerus]|uniref:TnsA-like heteromeric transposase endonuclease subunit n=1 Tax=Streptomyces albicerus TaxID=2569859 RepID=UPI00124B7BE9|nr:TnsA-like heteromeric transposase endonuclease subunit [Streptomyces albicerus]